MQDKYHSKNKFQGVQRLISGSQLRQIFASLQYVQRYIICTEDVGTDKEHVHFVVESDLNQLNLYRLRTDLKQEIQKLGKAPEKYDNGMLNISKVEKPERMMSYIMKERVDYVHNYDSAYIKECKKKSFLKKVSMTKAIQELKDKCYNSDITIQEYGVQYRLLRIAYKKPDPMWHKEIQRMQEMLKTEDQIKQEVQKFIEYELNSV